MLIKDVMTKAPACCTPDTKLDAVARMMLEHDCGEIPVYDGTKLVGVITDRDIACRAFTAGTNPLNLRAREVMTKRVYTVTAEEKVNDALELMEKKQVRRLPVVNGAGKVIGIVSQADLAAKLSATKAAELLRAVSKRTRKVAAAA